jgi:hypothetical protein
MLKENIDVTREPLLDDPLLYNKHPRVTSVNFSITLMCIHTNAYNMEPTIIYCE